MDPTPKQPVNNIRYNPNKQISFFSNFSSNVKFEEALDGCCKFHASGSDIIIAVGGGSVIDIAKIISVGPPDETDLLNIIDGRGRIERNAKLYCAPNGVQSANSPLTLTERVLIASE